MKKEYLSALKSLIFLILLFLIVFISTMVYSENNSSGGMCIISDGKNSSCNSVQSSSYGFIFGIPVSHVGLFAVIFLAVLFAFFELSKKYKKIVGLLFAFGLMVGLVSAIYFIFVQLFLLNQICSSCLVVDFSLIVLGIVGEIYLVLGKSIY